MIRFFAISLLYKLIICLTIFATPITGSGDTIFEEDDIKALSSPPPPPFLYSAAPGTKWCGPKKTALNLYDLGEELKTDMCCRDHDHCPDILRPKSTVHYLNGIWMPVLNCTCEQIFMNCLKSVNKRISYNLGRFYYSAHRYCMAENYPVVSCNKYQAGALRKRCIRYNMDTKKPRIWQFFDMPFFA